MQSKTLKVTRGTKLKKIGSKQKVGPRTNIKNRENKEEKVSIITETIITVIAKTHLLFAPVLYIVTV